MYLVTIQSKQSQQVMQRCVCPDDVSLVKAVVGFQNSSCVVFIEYLDVFNETTPVNDSLSKIRDHVLDEIGNKE